MSDRSVSDLIFRDLQPSAPTEGATDDRETTLREELERLRIYDTGPRVNPAGRRARDASEPER
jgi:hypothetical protein